MMTEEIYYENYYLDEEEIMSYTNINAKLFGIVKNKDFNEKCIKYLANVVKL